MNMFSAQDFMARFNISDDMYVGSVNNYFLENLEIIEGVLKKAKSKKFKEENNMTAYEAIAIFVFENYGISTTNGKPLSKEQVGDCLSNARKKRKGAVVAVKATAPVVAPPLQEKPVQAVVVAPAVAVPGAVPGGEWTKQDYDVVAKQLKESGWSHKFFEEKAVYYYGLYETNNYKNIPWNDELENLWIITQSKFPDAHDKMSDRYYYNIKGSLTYGVLAEFLMKNRPKQ